MRLFVLICMFICTNTHGTFRLPKLFTVMSNRKLSNNYMYSANIIPNIGTTTSNLPSDVYIQSAFPWLDAPQNPETIHTSENIIGGHQMIDAASDEESIGNLMRPRQQQTDFATHNIYQWPNSDLTDIQGTGIIQSSQRDHADQWMDFASSESAQGYFGNSNKNDLTSTDFGPVKSTGFASGLTIQNSKPWIDNPASASQRTDILDSRPQCEGVVSRIPWLGPISSSVLTTDNNFVADNYISLASSASSAAANKIGDINQATTGIVSPSSDLQLSERSRVKRIRNG